MKKRILAMAHLGMIFLLAAATGCGRINKGNPNPVTEQIKEDAQSEQDMMQALSTEDSMEDSSQSVANGEISDGGTQDDEQDLETLIGNIRSIDGENLIVSQSFEEGTDVLVAPTEGSSDEVLITVSVSENTQYQVKTVKNGGINGEDDVETTSGTMRDLQEGASIDISGYYEKECFVAKYILIYRFI